MSKTSFIIAISTPNFIVEALEADSAISIEAVVSSFIIIVTLGSPLSSPTP
jgi:hypothetical protein